MDSREIYIAVKPARFDRDYAVGEVIPTGVIDPGSERRLIEMGKIQRVMMPSGDENPGALPTAPLKGAVTPQGGMAPLTPDGVPRGEPLGGSGQSPGSLFSCHICGREMRNKSALTNHLKTHGGAINHAPTGVGL